MSSVAEPSRNLRHEVGRSCRASSQLIDHCRWLRGTVQLIWGLCGLSPGLYTNTCSVLPTMPGGRMTVGEAISLEAVPTERLRHRSRSAPFAAPARRWLELVVQFDRRKGYEAYQLL